MYYIQIENGNKACVFIPISDVNTYKINIRNFGLHTSSYHFIFDVNTQQ